MLQAIREKVTGWIAYGIIFLISVPFALWGVNSYLGGGEVLPAAIINGNEVSQQELDQAYTNYRQRLAQLFGGRIPESLGNESRLREQVLSQLIEEYALQQYTQKQGYRIADAELNKIIRNMDAFQRDGKFETETYQAQLRSLGYSPVGFEQQLRRNGSMEQFQNGILDTAFAVPVFEKQFASLNNQTRKIRSLTFRVDASSIDVDADEVDQYYQSNADRYRTQEKVKIDFIEVSLEAVKQGIQVSEDVVRARYNENKDAYSSIEIREASHILIKVNDDQDSDRALTEITEIRERIGNGESFADLAREFSEDPGSAQDGGNLGEIEPGIMVQTFEAALYSMQVDQLSEPVKTGFGWHLIKLHAIKGGETESFATVRTTLEDEIKTEMAEGQIYDLAENLANLTYEQSDSLLPAAEQLGLTVQTSDWFDRFSGEGISTEQKLRQAAFSPEVLQQGLNSEAIELSDDRVLFIRINQHQPAEGRPLEQVREQVVSEIKRGKARQQSEDAGKQALAELNSGKTLSELAEQWSDSIKDYGFVKRDQSDVDASILERGFSMLKPDRGIVFDGLPMDSGEYSIIELSAVISSDTGVDQEALDGLVRAQGTADYQSALKLISSRAEVVRTASEDLEDY